MVPSLSGEMTEVAPDGGGARSSVEPDGWRQRFLSPSTDAVVLAVVLVVCVRIGMAPLQDNSFFTHLATGRIILDSGSVPTADPYSWTAYGDPWTVQSWLASLIYAVIEDGVGLVGIRVLSTVLAMTVAVGLWKLTDTAEGLIVRAVAVFLALMVGVTMWVERPYMFGAVGLVLVLMAAEERLDPRWLVPILWIWANTHGSFVFAPALLVLLVIGRWLDERRRPELELRCLLWTVVGIALAAVGPLGTRVWTFPFEMIEKREVFASVREWQPLELTSSIGMIFVVQLLVTLLALARLRRWRAVLPAVAFGVAALTSARNVVPASIIITPIIAAGLHGIGSLKGADRPSLARPVVHVLTVVVVVTMALQLPRESTALDAYPVEAAAWMRDNGLMDTSSRVVSREVVGNYLEFAYGTDVRIFMDDRVDMFPPEVTEWYLDLIKKDRDHVATMERLDLTAVLWDHDSKLGRWLEESDEWEVVWRDDVWFVLVPT